MRRIFARILLGEFSRPLSDVHARLQQHVGSIIPDWDKLTPYQRKRRWLGWVDQFEPEDENDRKHTMYLAFEIGTAETEPDPDTLNQRMIKRENLVRLRSELAETMKRIDQRRIAFTSAADGTSATELTRRDHMAWLVKDVVHRRGAGKPYDRDTMVLALLSEFPNLNKRYRRNLFTDMPKILKRGGGRKKGRPNSGPK